MATNKPTGAGGKAEAAGSEYETLVAAWYCARILASVAGQPPLDLSAGTRIVSLRCQTDAPVDDINVGTSDGGIAFVQAKRTLHLSDKADSQFASALNQFVLQHKACAEGNAAHLWDRPLDATRDRLVLATRGASSSKITEILPRLLRAVRDRTDIDLLSEAQTSQADREVALVVERHITRSWKAICGTAPTRSDLGSIFRLMRVQVLDVEADGRDVQSAQDSLRANTLEEPDDSPAAFAALVKVCVRLRAERSGADLPGLMHRLAEAGLRMLALPDYRADIAALKKWSQIRLARAPQFSRLLAAKPETIIERDIWPAFLQSALSGSFLVVGEPGAGKSGLTYRLAATLADGGHDVVFLPIDILKFESFSTLKSELGISHDLPEILANWPGARNGCLVIDALDAARKAETQTILRDVIAQILTTESRWNVVASVRKYDLRQGTEWSRLFRGPPPDSSYVDPEFSLVSHMAIRRLTDLEISQVASSLEPLHRLYDRASAPLRALLRNVFNLHLLAQLLDDGIVSDTLAAITNQPELLGTYWRYRIQREDGKRDAREKTLTAILSRMISAKMLRVDRIDVRPDADAESLVDLERNDILRGEDVGGGTNEDVLLFTHHVIFDYAVARLIFRQGRDAEGLSSSLTNDPGLSVMLGPSISLALADAWTASGERKAFWAVAFALATKPKLPEVARLFAPMVVAESAKTTSDLEPIINALQCAEPTATAGEKFFAHLVGALLVRVAAGTSLAGSEAGPWLAFADRLSEIGNASTMRLMRWLLTNATDKPSLLTFKQLEEAGAASRRLLEFAWSNQPRSTPLVVAALNAVGNTFSSNPVESSRLLRRALVIDHLRAHGHEELHWLSRHVRTLAESDFDLVVEIYESAFGYEETSDEKTALGGSVLLSLSSNRRQDYESSWYGLGEALTQLLEKNPTSAMRAMIRALNGYVKRKHPTDGDEDRVSQQFALGANTANFVSDHSYSWYSSGVRLRRDAPVLLEKFDEYLLKIATTDGAATIVGNLVDTAAAESGLAVVWASLLKLGKACPDKFAKTLFPLACAAPIMTSFDTRHQVGEFIEAAYPFFDIAQRTEIEAVILSLEGKAGEHCKQVMAGCVPESLITTDAFRTAIEEFRANDQIRPNRPTLEFTSWSRPYGTEAYLEDEGVSPSDPKNADLIALMRLVEGAPPATVGAPIEVQAARDVVAVLERLKAALATASEGLSKTLLDHAAGVLADKASRLSASARQIVTDPQVREILRSALLFTSTSESPEFRADEESKFHESLSWGGPSARAAAGEGLMRLVRFDEHADSEVLAAIHRLARDPVPHVRLQIIQNLKWLHKVDAGWMWSELDYVIKQEPTRGVVGAALQAVANAARIDLDRAIGLAQSTLSRYQNEEGPGIAHCRESAAMLISDIYFWTDNKEAAAFFGSTLADIYDHSELIKHMIARYSDALNPSKDDIEPERSKSALRKVVAFYNDALDSALARVDELGSALDLAKFSTWPASKQQELRSMLGIADEIATRMFFASGARDARTSRDALTLAQVTFFQETRPLMEKLASVSVVPVAHHLIETLELFVPLDPPGIFALIARSVRASESGGYGFEHMAAELVVRIVERYLADHREVFSDPARLQDLIDCLDVFVKAGWPAAQSLTFRLGEIWR